MIPILSQSQLTNSLVAGEASQPLHRPCPPVTAPAGHSTAILGALPHYQTAFNKGPPTSNKSGLLTCHMLVTLLPLSFVANISLSFTICLTLTRGACGEMFYILIWTIKMWSINVENIYVLAPSFTLPPPPSYQTAGSAGSPSWILLEMPPATTSFVPAQVQQWALLPLRASILETNVSNAPIQHTSLVLMIQPFRFHHSHEKTDKRFHLLWLQP